MTVTVENTTQADSSVGTIHEFFYRPSTVTKGEREREHEEF